MPRGCIASLGIRYANGLLILIVLLSFHNYTGHASINITHDHQQLISSNQSGWLSPSQIGNHVGGGSIKSVSCPSTTSCYAVADFGEVMYFNGTSWSNPKVIDPNNECIGCTSSVSISCVSATFCVAVGADGTVTMLSGTTWSAPSLINTDYGSFTSVSCTSTSFCIAVDSNGYAYFYNGASWSSSQIDPNNYLTSISCASSNFCVAVDDAENATEFNGTTFSTPGPIYTIYSGLSAVSCVSISFCIAADYGGNVFSYNGTTWSSPVYQDPSGSYYGSVSCISASFCIAADAGNSTISTFNSGTWSSADTADANGFNSVSCISNTFCVAGDNSGDVISFNGSSWNTPQDIGGELNSISCSSISTCTAIDSGGTSWQWQAGNSFGNPWNPISLGEQSLSSISCPSSSFCMAVNILGDASEFNGASWQAPVNIDQYGLMSVSCTSSSFCVAVDIDGYAFFWNGTSWSSPSAANPDYMIDSISCVATSFCMSVGSKPVEWNGTSWSYPAVGTPTVLTSWRSVSCTSVSFCQAVDWKGNAYLWNGSAWSSNNTIDINNELTSVSCVFNSQTVSQFCAATDDKGNALIYDGTSWASPVNIDNSTMLTSVDCPSPDLCMALDIYGNYIVYSTPPPPTPVVSSVSPASGPTSGATTVTITGENLLGVGYVYFGSVEATSFTAISSAEIKAVSPAESAGTVDVTVVTTGGTSPTSTSDEFTYVTPVVPVTGDAYAPVNPARLADTRCGRSPQPSYCSSENLPAANSALTTLAAGLSENVAVTGVDNIPISATAVVINVTAVNMTSGGYLSIYPEGSTPAVVSSLNWTMTSGVVTNLVTVPVNTSNGEITVANGGTKGSVDFVVDIEGYYASPGSTPAGLYDAVTPTRLADSRCSESPLPAGITSSYCSAIPSINSSLVALGAGKSENITVTGVGGIPSSGVSAVVLNLTAIDPSAPGYFTAYPTGATMAVVSTVNFVAGQIVANRVIVGVGTGGQITIYNNSGTANFAVDVSGYYTDGSSSSQTGSLFNPVTPARIVDTRCSESPVPNYCSSENLSASNSTLGAVSAGKSITVQVGSEANIPSDATAFVCNLTATGGTGGGYLTMYTGSTAPTTSDVNFSTGTTDANMVIGQLSSSGQVNIANGGGTGSVNVLVDVSGWFTPSTS